MGTIAREDLWLGALLSVLLVLVLGALVVTTPMSVVVLEWEDEGGMVESVESPGVNTLEVGIAESAAEGDVRVSVLDSDGERVESVELVPYERSVTVDAGVGEYRVVVSNGEVYEVIDLRMERTYV